MIEINGLVIIAGESTLGQRTFFGANDQFKTGGEDHFWKRLQDGELNLFKSLDVAKAAQAELAKGGIGKINRRVVGSVIDLMNLKMRTALTFDEEESFRDPQNPDRTIDPLVVLRMRCFSGGIFWNIYGEPRPGVEENEFRSATDIDCMANPFIDFNKAIRALAEVRDSGNKYRGNLSSFVLERVTQ